MRIGICTSPAKQGLTRLSALAILGLALAPASGFAQASTADTATPEITVRAAAPDRDRQQANAARQVFGRDALSTYGDSQLSQMLARLPGVSVTGSSVDPQGNGREVRLRGMGQGYTQVQLNGEPVPQGFSIDSISPELIERVEIIRSATADASTQAIAGTINLVLRQQTQQVPKILKLSVSRVFSDTSGGLSWQDGWQDGRISASWTGQLQTEAERWKTLQQQSARNPDGSTLFRRSSDIQDQDHRLRLGLTPRMSLKLSQDESLQLDGLLSFTRSQGQGDAQRSTQEGQALPYARDRLAWDIDNLLAHAGAQWKLRPDPDARLEVRLGLDLNQRQSLAHRHYWMADDAVLQWARVSSHLQDTALKLAGKYSRSLSDAHTLGLGWDGAQTLRQENRIQREYSDFGFPTLDLDEDFSARVQRLALFAQDEWAIDSAHSLYMGLRWEGLGTRTSGLGLAPLQVHSSVWSPTAQWLWKLPGERGEQLRLALSRTYKAPTARELIPRRWVVNNNSATTPNFRGNPALVPELAWSLDLGYERYLAQGGFLGANVYARQIRNVVLQSLTQDETGTWFRTPYNNGQAQVLGLELEAKGRLRELWPDAPQMELRAANAFNRSRVANIPGPNNVLAQQPRQSTTIGLDHRLGHGWSWGASWVRESVDWVRSTPQFLQKTSGKRQWDLYALQDLGQGRSWRLSVLNVLRPDLLGQSQYDGPGLSQSQQDRFRQGRTLRLALDWPI
jgi:outer membrane receptor protein involved in Fe transport